MARYWSDGYKNTEQVGSPAETTVTMVDRVRWDNKQDPLVFDDHPVLGSESPVTSDGIARAMLQLQDFVKQKDVELCYIDVVTQADEAVLRDKTYIDIHDAYNNGKTLILRFVDSDDKCAYFYDFQGNVFRFVMFEVTDVLNMYTYWISPDDLLHTEQYSAPYKRPNPEVLSITYGDTSVKYDGSKHASVNIPKVPAWALGDTKPKYDASEVGAEAKGVAASRVNAHNNSDTAHADIRNLIANVMSMFNTYATTAQLNSVTQTVQGYASAVQTLRQDAVLHTEVVDDMYTNNSRMPLSAKQGMLLRTMYDALKGDMLDYVKNTDYATSDKAGVVIAHPSNGIQMSGSYIVIVPANEGFIDARTNTSRPITPKYIDYAVMKALSDSKLEWTDEQKELARTFLDAVGFTDYATTEKAGLVKINNSSGIRKDVNNCIYLDTSNDNEINNKRGECAVKTSQIDKVVRSGLAYSLLAWTDEEKASARGVLSASSDIITSASGEVVTTTDSAKAKPKNIKLFGKSKQDGIPSMETPIVPVHHGEGGSIGGKVLTSNLSGIVTVKNENLTQFTFALYLKTILYPNTTYKLSFKGTTGNQYYLNENLFENWDDTTVDSNGNAHITLTTKADISNENHSQYDESNGGWIILKNLANNQEHNITDVMLNLGDTVATYEPYTEQPFTFQTPNGLRGIPLGTTIPDAIKNSPIHMSGVCWDSVEQKYYIADTKNDDGKDVQRICKVTLKPSELFKGSNYTNTTLYYAITGNAFAKPIQVDKAFFSICNIYEYSYNDKEHYFVDEYGFKYFIPNEKIEDFLALDSIELCYVLAEPIVTDTDVQHDVVMNYPNTTIVNDTGAYTEVEYVTDPKLFITNNYVAKEQYNSLASRVLVLEQHIINS